MRAHISDKLLRRAFYVRSNAVELFKRSKQQQWSARKSSSARGQLQLNATQVLEKDRNISVQWSDGRTSLYHLLWLRVNCQSLIHSTGQRVVFPKDVDPTLKPVEVSTPSGAELRIKWSDGHMSEFKAGWLRAYDNSPEALLERNHRSWPTALCSGDPIPEVDGQAYMTDDSVLYSALESINQVGACRVADLGIAEGTVLDVARRIAPISHHMMYGEAFDVLTQEHARNIAYTSEALPFHMDLTHYESAPGLQLLHCVQFDEDVEGGESMFLDALEAARYFRDHFPEHFEVLCRVPAAFVKIRGQGTATEGDDRNHEVLKPAHMEYRRPHFQVDSNKEILAVTWAPMFEGMLVCPPQDMGPYYEAHVAFQRLMTDGPFAEKHTIRMNMEPGHCMVFNNRRLMHGRTEIKVKPGAKKGRRHLQGTYINIDEAFSRFLSLRTTLFNSENLAAARTARFGNGSYL